uniref:Uncharacterized protein n=1 Tax=Euplotes crassus TaxID=5936 RepID=A0A7S3KPT4_EUPCR|mmetsp:Transcript_38892/g.38477  ORF Transcript_38892/g.38477 Transcript_38892/m.38477 type:complete len:145 (+) Transcript_38892:86-520(+)
MDGNFYNTIGQEDFDTQKGQYYYQPSQSSRKLLSPPRNSESSQKIPFLKNSRNSSEKKMMKSVEQINFAGERGFQSPKNSIFVKKILQRMKTNDNFHLNSHVFSQKYRLAHENPLGCAKTIDMTQVSRSNKPELPSTPSFPTRD